MVKLLIFLICFLAKNVTYAAEGNEKSVAASVADMTSLEHTEYQLLSAIENYADLMERKLHIIRSALTEMRAENVKFQDRPEEYLSNPINSFKVIRRLHEDLILWTKFLNDSFGTAEVKRLEKLNADLPSSNDLEEATAGINRVQRIYNLQPSDIAAGYINGRQYDANFSAYDCYTIGYQLFKAKLYQTSELWLNVALRRYRDTAFNHIRKFDKVNILEIYSQAVFKQDLFTDALDIVNSALRLSPQKAELLKIKTEILQKIKTKDEDAVSWEILFERCCRGEFPERPTQLYCLYNTTTTAFLKIAPLKMEILNLDPYVVLYHDVISDFEIAIFKTMAMPVLKRAMVYNKHKNTMSMVSRRTSKVASFSDGTNHITRRLNSRVADMSGFDLTGAEYLQVMNYGLGGHYDPHYDAFNFTDHANVIWKEGDRIATVLFYLSNVEQGGATVFPYLKLAIKPQKGTAILWYNLDNQNIGHVQTLHGACPVVVGSKWVMTKWIREYSQMFRRPCLKK